MKELKTIHLLFSIFKVYLMKILNYFSDEIQEKNFN